ncbi:MAG TPA: hypothetical protein VM101_09315 [Flavitalea sp.]|nr:hypothetical protein [Flavitalea sp.]
MEKILSIPINYLNREFYSLVRVFKFSQEHFEVRVTIIDEEIDSSLHGNHIFVVREGKLQVDLPSEARNLAKLKLEIANALNKYFETHPLTKTA